MINKSVIISLLLAVSVALPAAAQQDEQRFQGFNLQGYNDSGEKAWDVVGETADVVDGTKIQLTNINANTYGERSLNVTAAEGLVDQKSGFMKLEKDVVITSDDGSQMMTDYVEWNREEDLVQSDDEVFIKNDNFTATGTGLEARPGMKSAQLKKDVTVRVDTSQLAPESSAEAVEPPKQFLTVTSDGPMVLDQLLNKARFEVNVVAEQEDQTLKADVIEIYFKEGMRDIIEMVCIGNVEITQGDNRTYAEKATYNAEDQKLTLSGRPKLILETGGENGIAPLGN
ncbi:MAG: LPS export ABC transporter periplasmic protein LptC [Candidatus Omnitrophica bacterium]|nr:LPS export ABC transporter periplasmic protein LptC [Candidatus Omnitrophota bacterium]MCB9721290.1 LPS export ABC transporter periplasmic protein LptC [Candidatus Omnitrophota bacterium]